MAEPHSHEPSDLIAIVAMACRLPGATHPDQLWRNLAAGQESIAFLGDDELREQGVAEALLHNPNYVRSCGGMIDGIDRFDAAFFGFSPREAQVTDPQQRLFLECAHEALERAGYDPDSYRGRIGVFAGAGRPVYLLQNLLPHPELLEAVGPVQATLGSDKDFVPTRVSYQLNLKGPSVNVQTACSTSLVAVHLACQSLLGGECDLVLAGGVSITTLRRQGYLYEEGGVYSPDGHCRAFDAKARGMVGGNGVAVVVLKRLGDALRDGDQVQAVIRGSAINNDGALKVDFTAPGVDGQAQVIAEALAIAGVSARTIGMVEAHGTGTALGDPIEVAALTQAYRQDTADVAFCALGSIKTNFGHTNAAAGCAGLIKAVLALQHGVVPPSLHFERPNPEIDFAGSPFFVNTALRPWPVLGAPRRAGVSSFGMGGTNAHVVLEQAPALPPTGPSRHAQLLRLSAKTQSALDTATAELAAYLREHPELDLADVAFTLHVGRRTHAYRRTVVATDGADAAQRLAALDPARVFGSQQSGGDRPVVFLFPGQGAQHVGMAAELYATEPRFRAELDRCADALRPHLEVDLRAVLYPAHADADATSRLQQTELAQPAIFAIEYALAHMWMEWGVRPHALVGHSVGELVAACIAGVLSLDDAAALVAERGRRMQQMPPGAMTTVPLPQAEVGARLDGELSLAAVNAPSLCVVAGPEAAVARLEQRLGADGITCRRLHTSHAFHSAMMDPIVAPFAAKVRQMTLHPAQIPCVSTVTGTWIRPEDWADPTYWARNLREPVRFSAAVLAVLADDARVLLEVGPGQALSTLVRQHGSAAQGRAVIASCRAPLAADSDVSHMLQALGRLWLAGVRIDWHAFYRGEQRRRVVLPTYPFERQRYWVDPPRAGVGRGVAARNDDVGAWFWAPSWQRTLPPPTRDAPGRWLVFCDEAGLGDAIAQQLLARECTVTRVRAGAAFAAAADGSCVAAPGARDVPALMNHVGDVRWIVHAWGVHGGHAVDVDTAQHRGFDTLLAVAQVLAARGAAARVVVVTDSLYAVLGGEARGPERATALGPCLVMPHEIDGVTCRHVDVALDTPLATLAARVVAEAQATDDIGVVAWRGAHRWRPAYEHVHLPRRDDALPLRRGGVYLITGGLGGVGLAIATLLAERLQAKLILVGRTPLPDRARWDEHLTAHGDGNRTSRRIRAVRAVEALGAEVMLVAADVAARDDLRVALDAARARFGPLHGVVHAAGLATGGLIETRTPDSAATVLSPKVQGTLVLQDLLRGEPLDWFVLCSSLAGRQGGVGAVDYCGANAFLDVLPHSDRGRGTPFVSIAWDTWAEVGMAAETAVPAELRAARQEFLRQGIRTSEGRDAFTRVLASGLSAVLVSTRDLIARLAAGPDELAPAPMPVAAAARPSLATTYVAPQTALQQDIAALWQHLLGVEQIGLHDNFFELGGHSLTGTRVTTRLRETYRVELPLRALFQHPTIAAVAEFIEMARWATQTAAQPVAGERDEVEF